MRLWFLCQNDTQGSNGSRDPLGKTNQYRPGPGDSIEVHLGGASLGTESVAGNERNHSRNESEIKGGLCVENGDVLQIKYPVKHQKV